MKNPEQYKTMLVQLDADNAQSKTAAVPPFQPDGVVLTCGSDLTPEPVRWLWPNWLALGKLHILNRPVF